MTIRTSSQMAVMKPWIAKKVIELLGFEDDVLIEYIHSLLEDPENPVSRPPQRSLPGQHVAPSLTRE